PQLVQSLAQLLGRALIEALDLDVADARAQEESARDAWGGQLGRNQSKRHERGDSGPPDHELRLLLPRLPQQLDELFQLEPVDPVAVDLDNLVARRETGAGRRRAGKRLENYHPTGRDRDNAAEALLHGLLHIFERAKLVGVEEGGERVERMQKSGDGAG